MSGLVARYRIRFLLKWGLQPDVLLTLTRPDLLDLVAAYHASEE